MRKLTKIGLVAIGIAASIGFGAVVADDAKQASADPALDRARAEVQKLDALYKNAVVAVTDLYDGPPAIKVAKRVFAAMEAAGHHSARLVDVTGSPMKDENLPKSSGKPYYDEVISDGKSRRLYAATVVPAVHKKCASCHGVKEGDLLGFIRYDVPVDTN
jgi:hypothetical protein